jgi:hypothetical protein
MHFYDTNGQPCHEVPNEAARKRGQEGAMRDTTIADARKLRLLPSVTTYTKIVEKDWLTDAKLRRMVGACYANRPNMGEAEEPYYSRMDGIAFKDWNDWRELGTRVHDAIEGVLASVVAKQPRQPSEECEPYVNGVLEWLGRAKVEPTATEERLVNVPAGYAGSCDLPCYFDGQPSIGDFKVTGIEPGEKPKKSPEYAMQIAAYGMAKYGMLPKVGFNLFISRGSPGHVVPLIYNESDIAEAWYAFHAVMTVWRYVNNYDPRGKVSQ